MADKSRIKKMAKFIKNILATIWIISWALILVDRNDFAPKDKAEGELSIEGK